MNLIERSKERLAKVSQLISGLEGCRVFVTKMSIGKKNRSSDREHLVVYLRGRGIIVVNVMDVPHYQIFGGSHQEKRDRERAWSTQRSAFLVLSDLLYGLRDKLHSKMGKNLPVPYTGVLAFPESGIVSTKMPPAFPKESFLLASDFQDRRRLAAALGAALGFERLNLNAMPRIPETIDHRMEEVLGEILGDGPPAGQTTSAKTDEMTRAQANVYAQLARDSMTVAGMAGSGKTILATAIAKKWGEAGGNSAFVCRNKLLKFWMRIEHRDSHFMVLSPEDLASRLRAEAGLAPVSFPSNPASPELADETELAKLSMSVKPYWDCLVVDEAQDFTPASLAVMRDAVKKGGACHLYFDADQVGANPNQQQAVMPAMGTHLELEENCRNTQKINQLASKISQKFGKPNMRSVAWAEAGTSPEILKGIQKNLIAETAAGWLRDGFLPSSIVLLTLAPRDRSVLREIDEVSYDQPAGKVSVPIISDGGFTGEKPLLDWINNVGILWTTARAFKGLEASCVLLCEVPAKRTPEDYRSMFIGVTRAKTRLAILADDRDDVQEFTV
jgi:hypothetical protein